MRETYGMKHSTSNATLAAAMALGLLLASCPLESAYQLAPEKVDKRLAGTWRTKEQEPDGLESIQIELKGDMQLSVKDLDFDWDYYWEYAEDDYMDEYDGMPAELYSGTVATVGKRKYLVVYPLEPETYYDDYYYYAYELSKDGMTVWSTSDDFSPRSEQVKSAEDLRAWILKNQDNPKFFAGVTHWVKD